MNTVMWIAMIHCIHMALYNSQNVFTDIFIFICTLYNREVGSFTQDHLSVRSRVEIGSLDWKSNALLHYSRLLQISYLRFQLFEKFNQCSNLMLLLQYSLQSSVLGGWLAVGVPELVSEPSPLFSNHSSAQLFCSSDVIQAGGFTKFEGLGIN